MGNNEYIKNSDESINALAGNRRAPHSWIATCYVCRVIPADIRPASSPTRVSEESSHASGSGDVRYCETRVTMLHDEWNYVKEWTVVEEDSDWGPF
jgi:hypothetical protein